MTKENLLKYKMDYSVYILRYEKKRLGRLLKDINLDQEDKRVIELQINQIKDTLQLLKEKFQINNPYNSNVIYDKSQLLEMREE